MTAETPRRKLTLREAWELCDRWDQDYEATIVRGRDGERWGLSERERRRLRRLARSAASG